MIEKLKNGLVYDLDCGYCRGLAESLTHYTETDKEGAKEVSSLQKELEEYKEIASETAEDNARVYKENQDLKAALKKQLDCPDGVTLES